MKQEKEFEEYKRILEEGLPDIVDSEFVNRYFSKFAQIKLGIGDIDEFEDALLMNGLSGLDCSNIDFSSLTQEEFESIPFDTDTVFSNGTIAKFNPEEVLERGKNFGLGLEELPVSGKGIHIAIRDQNCNPYLVEANIVDYTRVKNGKVSKQVSDEDTEHMHGKTTTSLLASKSCGVAKDSLVHFFSGSIPEYVQYIVDYNKTCIDEGRTEDMILVASGSWRDKDFVDHADVLRSVGCELICANNFDLHFNEFTSNGGSIQFPLEFTDEEIDEIISMYPEKESEINAQAQRSGNVKIPISRTYHQLGEEGGFKYQSSYSTSWGIPQVAGLFAVFKEIDRGLTFEKFCNIAEQTATGEKKIINPDGIYREVSRGKNGLDDCLADANVNVTRANQATEAIKKEILLKDDVLIKDSGDQK